MPRRTLHAVAILASVIMLCATPAQALTLSAQPIPPRDPSPAKVSATIHLGWTWVAAVVANDRQQILQALVNHQRRENRRNFYRVGGPAVAQNPAAQTTGGPTPISSARCADRGRADIGALIEQTFGSAGPWAESVAVRESSCTPGIYNSLGCLGLFQFCGHRDIFSAVCGPYGNWGDAGCEVRAAYHLYQGSGTSPWSL